MTAGGGASRQDPEVDCLIMIDRSVDLISPFCVQANYEGLLDETFGVECASMTVPRTIMVPDTEENKNDNLVKDLTVKLTNDDSLFRRVRDCSLPMLGLVTKKLLRDL